MNTWKTIQEDFDQEYQHSTYQGRWRQVLHTLTAPGFQGILAYRISHGLLKHRIPFLGVILQRLAEVWTGISISPATKIGAGLVIYHFGGIIINSQAVLGRHCRLHHDVTIGNRVPGGPSPKIGDRVMIGAGARILGGITIGDDVEIGANAVVLEDVPAGAVAVGVPAKVVRVKEKEESGVTGKGVPRQARDDDERRDTRPACRQAGTSDKRQEETSDKRQEETSDKRQEETSDKRQ